MKKKFVVLVSSLVIFTGFSALLVAPKNSKLYALTLKEGVDKLSVEKELGKKYNITRDFSDFSVYTFDTMHSLSDVRKNLAHFGEVELITSHQMKILEFLRKLI